MVTVSIILPTHNRASRLQEAVKSVLSQTFTDWELIVIDDGSTDDTREVVRGLREKNADIRYVFQKQGGVSRARNTGIAMARGKYVAMLDDDDCWTPEKLQRQVEFMEQHTEIGMVSSQFETRREQSGKVSVTSVLPEKPGTCFEEIIYRYCIATPTVLMRKACLDAMSLFNSQYLVSSDWDLWLRFSQKWKVASQIETFAYTLQDTRESLSKNELRNLNQCLGILRDLERSDLMCNRHVLIQKHVGRLNYRVGHVYLNQNQYGQAARYFGLALKNNPLVGLMRHERSASRIKELWWIFKPYLITNWCFLRGVLHV